MPQAVQTHRKSKHSHPPTCTPFTRPEKNHSLATRAKNCSELREILKATCSPTPYQGRSNASSALKYTPVLTDSRYTRECTYIHQQTGEKPFVCPWVHCGKQFVEKGNLSIHIRSHTKEKPFVCHICSKLFTTKGHLKDHERTHTGERPFMCKFCNEKFMRSSTLKVHIRRHTGEKPYCCPFPGCNKKFTESGNVKIHMRVHSVKM